jgi:type II secretion system protein I
MKAIVRSGAEAFTLLEVMIAIAFIGIALIALLALHRSDLQSVIRGEDLTRAAMLAQSIMAQAEIERFPAPGQTHGDFSQLYPGQFPRYRWTRDVTQSPLFPDVERVVVVVQYGPEYSRSFDLTEFIHNPSPPSPNGNAADSGSTEGGD